MIRELVFHIGDPKTGTSSIQAAMQRRAWRCDSVSVAVQEELNASALANSLRFREGSFQKRQRELTAKRRWVAENDADLGIVSAEFFFLVDPARLRQVLQRHFPDHVATARFIAYARPHASRILSAYAQSLKCDYFPGTLEKYCKVAQGRERMFFRPRFDRWREAFGDNFVLRPFIRSEMRDGDVVADFFHTVLRGADFELDPLPPTNESLSPGELAGVRVVQSVIREKGLPAFMHIPIGGAIGRRLAGMSGRSRERLRLDRPNAERIRATYAEDARMLDAAYFDRPLFAEALERAVDEAIPQAPSLEAQDHFDEAGIADLKTLAAELAAILKKRPMAWRRDYQLRIGQIRPGDFPPPLPADRKNAAAAWERIEGIAQVLAGGEAPPRRTPVEPAGGKRPGGRARRQADRTEGETVS